MTVTKVGIVYSKAQKVRRRLIKLDHAGAHDGEFEHHKKHMHPNEEWLEIPVDLYNELDSVALDAWIEQKIGAPLNDLCAVVCQKDGEIKYIIHADPEIDIHPDGNIVPFIIPVEVDLRETQDIFDEENKMSMAKIGSFNTDWVVECRGDILTIGCESRPIEEWKKLTDAEAGILGLPAIQTAKWWRSNKSDIFSFALRHKKMFGIGGEK